MDRRTVLIRTPAGQREIAQRSGAISPRARQVLILLGGKEPVATLMDQAPAGWDMGAILLELLRAGLVQDPSRPDLAPDDKVLSTQNLEDFSLPALREYLTDFVRTTLGSKDGKEYIDMIAAANTGAAMRDVIRSCTRLVEQIAGAKKGAEFVANLRSRWSHLKVWD